MTSLSRKLSLAAFVVLTGAFATNVLVLQPPGRGMGSSATAQLGQGSANSAWVDQLNLKTAGISNTAAEAPATPAGPVSSGGSNSGDTVELTRAIQRELKVKGYETGAVDGVPGIVTRAAIMAYEADAGLQLTGEPRQPLLQHIVLGSARDPGQSPKDGGQAGPYAETIIKSVQKALTQLGYSAGAVSGHMSPETTAAIRKFETTQRWPETGRVSGELVAKLAGMTGHSAIMEMR
jgi:peptidoglycan hydrolase-like protein with peptidoglycan-binding domain